MPHCGWWKATWLFYHLFLCAILSFHCIIHDDIMLCKCLQKQLYRPQVGRGDVWISSESLRKLTFIHPKLRDNPKHRTTIVLNRSNPHQRNQRALTINCCFFLSRLFGFISAKGMYVGAPCEFTCHAKLHHVYCDPTTNTCSCEKDYVVLIGILKGCAKRKFSHPSIARITRVA